MASNPKLILDCSITMAWCFEDEINPYSEEILDLVSKDFALVPALWAMEVTNVLLMAQKRKRLTHRQSIAFIESLNELHIQVDNALLYKPILLLHELAKETDLTAYDATYLELAIRTGLPLATLDQDLIHAAKNMKVALF